MRRVIVALLLIGAGALLYAWRASDNAAPSRSVELERGQAPGPLPGVKVSVAPLASGREQAQTPQPATAHSAPEAIGIEERVISRVEDADWDKRYAGWSTPRLDARLLELEAIHQAEVERLCNLRFEAGKYRVVPTAEMEGPDSAYDVLASFDQQGLITRTRIASVATLDPPQPTDDDEPAVEYQVVNLALDAYPELYRQRSEVEWLRATLAARIERSEDPR